MVATTFDITNPDTDDAANAHTDIQNRLRWLLLMSQMATAVYDRNIGDGSVNEAKQHAFSGMGLPGWDGVFTVGDLDYPDTFILTEEGATGRKIRVNFTWSAESATGRVTDMSVDYDNGVDGYVAMSDLSGTTIADDLVTRNYRYNYKRPRQIYLIDGATSDVQRGMRDNMMAILHVGCFRGHLYTQYVGIPGATITEVPTASTTPTEIVVSWASGLAFKFEFTYYPSHIFGGTVVLPKQMTASVRRKTGESYMAAGIFHYLRTANGMLFSLRPV